MWYVTGTNTQYQLHHRPLEDGEDVRRTAAVAPAPPVTIDLKDIE